jgi:hypothetical protein
MDILRLVWHFFLHILFGTLLFSAIGAAAVLLHWFVNWVEAQGVWYPVVYGLRSIEYLVLILDALAYVWFFIRVFWKFVREIGRQTR